MANTKKEWKSTPLAEKIYQIYVNVAVILIGLILPIFAYLVPAENSWPAVWVANDPGWMDAICWTVYGIGVFMLSGVYTYIPGIDDDEDPWKIVTVTSLVGAVLAVLAMILI